MDEQLEQPATITPTSLSAYSAIVKPGWIWTASEYLLTRWLPYLQTTDYWLIVGARQLSYRHGKCKQYKAYDATMAACVGVGVSAYRNRVKPRIATPTETTAPYLAYFLTRKKTRYEPRPGGPPVALETVYKILLDDPLTPADRDHLIAWLRTHAPEIITPQSIAQLLRHAVNDVDRSDLLAPPSDGIQDDANIPVLKTVVEIVEYVFQKEAGESKPVWHELADLLHRRIVQPEKYYAGTHYFRLNWLARLGAGPAALITYLRAGCHYKKNGDLHNLIPVTTGQLEQIFHISSKTLSRWIAKLQDGQPDTFMSPFLEVEGVRKLSNQAVETTYRVSIHDPLVPHDLPLVTSWVTDKNKFRDEGDSVQLDLFSSRGSNPAHAAGEVLHGLPGNGQNQIQGLAANEGPGDGQNGGVTDKIGRGDGQNRIHVKNGALLARDGRKNGEKGQIPAQNGALLARDGRKNGEKGQIPAQNGGVTDKIEAGNGQNQIHAEAGGVTDKIRRGDGQNQEGSWTKSDALKYYNKIQLQLVVVDLPELDDCANLPFVVVVAATMDALLDRLNIQGKGRHEVKRNGWTASEILAWYLWAINQAWATEPAGYVVQRVLEGQQPPSQFLQFANMPWGMWRTYAICNHFALDQEACEFPFYAEWQREYGAIHPDSLPFDVGKGIADLIPAQEAPVIETPTAERRPAQPDQKTITWNETLAELELQMTKATFTWFQGAVCTHTESDHSSTEGIIYVVAVATDQAKSWLEQRLKPSILRTLQAIDNQATDIQFVVK